MRLSGGQALQLADPLSSGSGREAGCGQGCPPYKTSGISAAPHSALEWREPL